MTTELAVSDYRRKIDEVYGNKQAALANALIQAREKTSLLESKIELLAIYKIGSEKNVRSKQDASGKEYSVHYVVIPSREISTLTGAKKNNGSLYSHIEAAAMELKKKLYIYRDKGSEQFVMKSLYGDVEYNKGKLLIDFNPETEHLFLDLKDNFSKIRLDVALKFQTNGGFQLYKLLKSFVYDLPEPDLEQDQKDFKCLVKTYSLSEFRLQMGYVDLNQPEIQKESLKAYPDADKIESLEKKPKYKRWNDFYNRVIEPGIKEINEISDIYIDCVEKELAAHGKVDGVTIRVQHNKEYYLSHARKDKTAKADKASEGNVSEEQMDDLLDEMRDLIKENIKTKDMKAIAKVAGYDMDKIRKAYELSQSATIETGIVNWMIAAIKGNYSAPVKQDRSGSNRKNGFHNFTEREYDFGELERKFSRN